jgi:hypothetical protein
MSAWKAQPAVCVSEYQGRGEDGAIQRSCVVDRHWRERRERDYSQEHDQGFEFQQGEKSVWGIIGGAPRTRSRWIDAAMHDRFSIDGDDSTTVRR